MWNFSIYKDSEALVDDSGRRIKYYELDAILKDIRQIIPCEDEQRPVMFLICNNSIDNVLIYIMCIQYHFPIILLSSSIIDSKLEKLYDVYQPEYIWLPSTDIREEIVDKYGEYCIIRHKAENTVVNKELANKSYKRGIHFQPMYGQTEATARITVMPMGMAVKKTGSVGVPIDGYISLLDESGMLIKESEKLGKLVYHGENVAMGYALGRNDLSKGDEWHGELDTGDYAWMDNDGYLYIHGRKDEYIKICGKRISSSELILMLEKEFIGSDFYISANDDGINVHQIKMIYYKEFPMLDNGKIDYNKMDRGI